MRKKLNISDKLYRAITYTGIFEYTVIGIRERENSSQYEVRCETCRDHKNCELLIAYNDYDKLIHIEMLNEDEELCKAQRLWHNNEGYYFQINKRDAEKDRALTYLKSAQEAVNKAKASLVSAEKHLVEIQDLMNVIENKRKVETN